MAESRNEALLENMLGGDNVIVPPQSRNEAILYAIVNNLPSIPEPYTGTPQSRIEALLVELYEQGGGGAVLIDKIITENGVYNAAEDNADGYREVTVDVGEIPEKAINFYNTDGTILYSYTNEEVEVLTELPAVPDREGYIAQGWTATLEQIKSAVEAGYPVNVGVMYITDDGATRLHLRIPEGVPLDFDLYTQINNGTLSVEIDGTEVASETESSSSFVNHTISFTIPTPETYPYDVDISLKYTGSAGFHIGENTVGSRIFGWNSDQNDCLTGISYGENITTITGYAFDYCNSLEEIIIPQGVTSIGDYAFYGCSSLKNVVIPQGVTSIGSYAFYGCSSLNSVVIPSSVTSIGSYAFSVCSSLNSVVIPSSVTSIGAGAFYGCSSLHSVVIPSSVTSIGGYAFYGCSSLNSVVIPSSVTSIGAGAFQNCASLNSVVIPSSVTSIGGAAFYGCSSLHSVVIPSSVTSIGGYAFYGCSSLKNVVIPQGVTSIDVATFYGCSSLHSVVIPSSVTSIGADAFRNCASLNSVVIPSSVTSIGGYAFYGCSSLNSVVIPSSVTSIGAGAFQNCALLMFLDLTDIISINDIPTLENANALSGTAAALKIYVANQEMLEAFSTATNWSTYSSHFEVKT